MKLLLDTHAVVWWVQKRGKVSRGVRDMIRDPSNEVLVSAASAWEMAIKHENGKLPLPAGFLDDFDLQVGALGWGTLSIEPADGIAASRLPRGHKDPFDRLIAAQAIRHGLVVATVDKAFVALGARVIW